MKLLFLSTVMSIVFIVNAQENKAAATTTTTKPSTPVPTVEVKSTVPSKNYEEILEKVCKKCHCDKPPKTLDCSHLYLQEMLSMDELMSLNYSRIPFETLRFDGNDIKTLPAFPALPIKNLILHHNSIENITKRAFIELQRLEVLDLSHNMLLSKALTPDVFEGKYSANEYEPFDFLTEINLSRNRLHSLHPDLFEHFPNLETLDLAENTFQVINEVTLQAITSITHLKNLDLSYMELRKLPEHLFHAPRSLETLNLTGNLLKTIPNALIYAINLKKLNLDENPLDNLEGENIFPRLPALESLSMSYMSPIGVIGKGALSGLENLKELMITNNPHLTFIHQHALCRSSDKSSADMVYPPLEKLYVHSNKLSKLDKAMLDRWDRLSVLDIRGNPWICDCENDFLIHTLYPQIFADTPVLSNDIQCSQPSDLYGKEIHEIYQNKRALRCPDAYGNRPNRDGAILIGVMIGLLVGIALTFALVLMYRRGYFAFLGHPGTADHNRAFYKRAELQDDYQI